LAGGNLIYESSGMTAALLGASFEGFVLDDEMHSMTYRALRGIEVSDDTLGYDAMVAAITGDGHFLGSDHTYRAMERDYFYPALADRDEPRTWAQNGAQTAFDRAKTRVDTILRDHTPQYLSADQDAKIRAAFPIRHPARS
ncbi:MAG: trimethylamine methyltransferase family protein, partial [Pseudomonadota bacterium]